MSAPVAPHSKASLNCGCLRCQAITSGDEKPRTIAMDNGPEFTSKRLDQWAYLNGVELDFSRPGKPTGNAMIEAFNVRLREKCLNESWFLSLEDARKKIGPGT